MSVKRIVIALLLAAFGAAAVSAQEAGDLSFHKTVAGATEFIQRTAVLPVPAPQTQPQALTKASGPLSVANQLAVDAALHWQVQHGYLTDNDLLNGGWDVSVSGSGITITIHVVGGPDIVIILSNGPFLPTDIPHRLMTVTVARPVQIYNGF